MTIINTSPDRTVQLGYEGEDRVTVLRFRYSDDWLENGEGIFHIRVRRHGEHTAYNAALVANDAENNCLLMTVTNVELSVKGSGEMQVVYSGEDFVKKSPIYSYNVSRAVDEVADPPAQDVYTQIIESLSDLQMDVQGLADAVDGIGNLADLTTTAKTDLVSAINEINEHSGGSVTVDDVLSTTSENPVQNKVITSVLAQKANTQDVNGMVDALASDVGTLRTSVQSKADTQTVSALADAVNGLDSDVQGLQTTVQAKADTSTVTALSGTVSNLSDSAQQYMEYTNSAITNLRDSKASKSYVDGELATKANTQTVTALSGTVTGLQTSKADKSYVDTGLAGKASTQTVSDLSDDVSDLQTGLAGKVEIPHTDEAKIAIQKMLGIYEAPWELINEETFTNDTEADYIITTDSNGNAFELTDLIILFETPKQSTSASKGYYGHIWCYYGNGDSQYMSFECGSWTQEANAAYHTCGGIIENKGGLMMSTIIQSSTGGARTFVCQRIITGFSQESPMSFIRASLTFTKINIRAVTGTGHYKLYGKRKWT